MRAEVKRAEIRGQRAEIRKQSNESMHAMKGRSEMKQFHVCQSVEGPLMNWTTREWMNATKWITKLDGSRMTWMELKAAFLKLHGEGKKVIPMGKECEGFNYETGCPGHEIEERKQIQPDGG